MKPRLDPMTAAPGLMQAMFALEKAVQESGLEKSLVHLVKMRASQLNGCAFCLHMHSSDARAEGESEARLYLLNAWRESSMYTARERAALAWTEALTLLPQTHAPDETWAEVKAAFDDAEQVALSLLIGTINTWNRIAVGFRSAHPHDLAAAA